MLQSTCNSVTIEVLITESRRLEVGYFDSETKPGIIDAHSWTRKIGR